MQQRQQGFTLIEIAIVLVIVGILLGGILKGQEMLTQGKIRAVEKELDSVAVAILGYRDRYKALPGDDSTVKQRWTTAEEGDGDGLIDEGERIKAWQHLRFAGLISGDPTSDKQPVNAVGGVTDIQDGAGTTTKHIEGTVICTTNLPAKIATAVDAQLDDGLPNKGSILAFNQSTPNTPTFDKASEKYADDGKQQYTLCRGV